MALRVRNMCLRRGTGPDGFELRIPALTLGKGHAVALHGPSGLGKSTCLELLAGVVRPDEVELFGLDDADGEEIDLASPDLDTALLRAGPIGYGPQSGGMLGFLNGWDNARASISLSGLAGDPEIEQRFDRLMARLQLEDCLSKNRGALSGGQRKRVSLLRAMALPRFLLVLDEPTAGLDDALADCAVDCILRVCRDEGTICIAAMHDVERAAEFGMIPMRLEPTAQGAVLATVAA
jgi:ABC-type multidrug transport system ATPase subunit